MVIKIFDEIPKEARFIRETVFLDEQGFEKEYDENDNVSKHIVIYDESTAVATCRVYWDKEVNCHHVGRIAVLKPYRGKGYGEKILLNAERVAKEKGADSISLSAQVRASGFYEKLGYKKHGEIYFDEYCEHIAMKKDI